MPQNTPVTPVEPETPPLVAVMVAGPPPTPVATPLLASMVATVVSEDDHVATTELVELSE
jgi:hypothetical protein